MSRNFSVSGLSHHASERAFERTRLTASEVSALIEQKHFYWASSPREGKTSFALVYDALAGQFVVAVVAPYDRRVKTLLTLEQFEQTYFTVSPAAKLLARLAIFSQASQPAAEEGSQDAATTKVAKAVEEANPLSWQFVVTRSDDSPVPLAQLAHPEVCRQFVFLFPVQDQKELKRRAVRVLQTTAFLPWFVEALKQLGVNVEDVVGLQVDAIDEADVQFSADLTSAFARLLQADNPSAANTDARLAGRQARRAFKRQSGLERSGRALDSRRTSYAVDLMFA